MKGEMILEEEVEKKVEVVVIVVMEGMVFYPLRFRVS